MANFPFSLPWSYRFQMQDTLVPLHCHNNNNNDPTIQSTSCTPVPKPKTLNSTCEQIKFAATNYPHLAMQQVLLIPDPLTEFITRDTTTVILQLVKIAYRSFCITCIRVFVEDIRHSVIRVSNGDAEPCLHYAETTLQHTYEKKTYHISTKITTTCLIVPFRFFASYPPPLTLSFG